MSLGGDPRRARGGQAVPCSVTDPKAAVNGGRGCAAIARSPPGPACGQRRAAIRLPPASVPQGRAAHVCRGATAMPLCVHTRVCCDVCVCVRMLQSLCVCVHTCTSAYRNTCARGGHSPLHASVFTRRRSPTSPSLPPRPPRAAPVLDPVDGVCWGIAGARAARWKGAAALLNKLN